MPEKEKYKAGIKGIKYKTVPSTWRNHVEVRHIRKRRPPINPMVLDLLEGKTIFAYGEDRTTVSFGSLYAVAASNGRVLRMYQFDDIDDNIYKGYLIWMDKLPYNKRN